MKLLAISFVTAFAAACSARASVAFHATATFQPRPGPPPTIVTEKDQLPRARLRSVGVVEVRDDARGRALTAVRAKGAELGCQYLVAHDLFVEAAVTVELDLGARVVRACTNPLVHGGKVRPHMTLRFDCAFEVTSDAPVTTSA